MFNPRHPILEITKARLREFYREPGALFWVFGFPVIMSVVLGIAFANRPPEKPRVALVNSPDSAALEKALNPKLAEVFTMERNAADIALRKGRVDVALIAGRDGGVTFLYDSTRTEARIARMAVNDIIQRAAGRNDAFVTSDLTPTIPGSRYIEFLIPGIIGLNIMSSSLWGVGYSLVHSRKKKVLRRLAATPMRRSHFLLGYMLFRMLFLVWEITAVLVFAHLVFNVTVQGSLLTVALAAGLGAMAFVGLSLLVASRTESLEAASGWMNFLMLPSWLLSGTFFSYERFPAVFHPYIKVLPLTALNDAVRAVFNEAASLFDILPNLLILLAWAGVSFVISLRIFKWS
jgi:ABC-type multidrug transport system permease subunit